MFAQIVVRRFRSIDLVHSKFGLGTLLEPKFWFRERPLNVAYEGEEVNFYFAAVTVLPRQF